MLLPVVLAAAFVAMTSDLPYRAARTVDEAIEELQRCAGTQFDPACVEALGRSVDVIEGDLASEALEANSSESRWG